MTHRDTSSKNKEHKVVEEVGRQTLLRKCYNCGERMHILKRYSIAPGGRKYQLMSFWICQRCGEQERPLPPPSAFGF